VGRSDVGHRATRVLGIVVVNLSGASGNTLCCWSDVGPAGNTLYWVLLLVYVGARVTHFSAYCCWFCASGNTLLGIGVG
jgi:hypothetical protein